MDQKESVLKQLKVLDDIINEDVEECTVQDNYALELETYLDDGTIEEIMQDTNYFMQNVIDDVDIKNGVVYIECSDWEYYGEEDRTEVI